MRELTIVFDLDGTLVDTAPDLVAATNHALSDLGLASVQAPMLRPFISLGARRMIVEGLHLSGRRLAEAEIDRLLELFLQHYEANIARESRPYEGVLPVLHALRQQGARLAVCTNKRETLSRKLLAELAMTPLFDAIAGRDTFAVSKPHPGHLTGAVRLAGGDIYRAIMVGDTIVDIETAKGASLPSVLVTFGYSDIAESRLEADATISHYDELMGAIQTLRPRLVSNPQH